MFVYYNEFDRKKCAALQALMDDGHISKGHIDNRPIQEVSADDVKGYTRCHFFAGIGLWDYALELAGWPTDRPVWTGSCPCQPFSSAGRQKGKADDRHLWPHWQCLIGECRPANIFGEQVSSAIAHGWLDDVYQGLEAQGYAIGAAVLPACSVGAPHKRDRLWFVAHSALSNDRGNTGEFQSQNEFKAQKRQKRRIAEFSGSSTLGNAHSARSQGRELYTECGDERAPWSSGVEWIDCPDGKKRLVEPGIRLLADGYPERVGLLHCAGDAIVPQVAAEFITAYMEG